MAVSITCELQLELAGAGSGWTTISDVVLPIELDYGIKGFGPLDIVASTGSLRWILNNGPANSGGKLGYYSREHANRRTGFTLGIGARLKVTHNGTSYYKFAGWLNDADPAPFLYGTATQCQALDWMDEAARAKVNVPTQVSKHSDQVLDAIVDAVSRQPVSTSYDTGDEVFTYALDNTLTEAESALSLIQAVALSEYGRVVIRGNTSAGGVLRFYKRTSRVGSTPTGTFADNGAGVEIADFSASYRRDDIINHVRIGTHPRRVDGSNVVLFSLQSVPAIAAGEKLTFDCPYNDPANRASRVGGTSMVAPVATTDYKLNTAADGSGTDITGSATVTATFGANSAKVEVTNGSASSGFVTLLQLRGIGLYDYDAVWVTSTDATSITANGERVREIDMPYQSSQNNAGAVGAYIIATWKDQTAVGAVLTIQGSMSDDLMTQALAREPGDLIAVIESATGITANYWIQGVRLAILPGYEVRAEFLLQRARMESYWQLGDTGKSELGETTVVGPL